MRTKADAMAIQYQEAQDPPLPLAQGNRPQVQEEPQACSSRHHARSGAYQHLTVPREHGPLTNTQKEVKEGKRDSA